MHKERTKSLQPDMELANSYDISLQIGESSGGLV